jgi:hypothetical protein
MKKILPAVCLITILLSTTAIAFPYRTGNDLFEGWREYHKDEEGRRANKIESAFYIGYVMGAIDKSITVKIPAEVTVGQLCSIVGKYIDDNPGSLTLRAGVVIEKAVYEVFPDPIIKKWQQDGERMFGIPK